MSLQGIKKPFAAALRAIRKSVPSPSGTTSNGRHVKQEPARLPHDSRVRTPDKNTRSAANRQISMPSQLKALVLQNQAAQKKSTFEQLSIIGRRIKPTAKDALTQIKGLALEVDNERNKKNFSMKQVFSMQSIMTGKLHLIAKDPNKVNELNESLIKSLIGPENAKNVITTMRKTINDTKIKDLEIRLKMLRAPEAPKGKLT